MVNNKNKEISNIVFANLSKISTQDLVVSFFDNVYNFDSEIELMKKVINEIANRKDLKAEYMIYPEDDAEYIFSIKEKIDENIYLFEENQIDIDKILRSLPQTKISQDSKLVNNKYYNFDLFLEDTSLSSEQRILVLNNFIKENKYLKQIAVLIIEDYKIFTEKQIKELIDNLIETKKLSNSYLGYLLFNQYKNLSLDTKNTLINLIDSDPKSQVYLIASIITNFDDFPEKIRNKYIDKYLDKISDNKENRISLEEVMESLNDTELFPFQDDEEDNSEVNKILRTVAATTNISLKDYYMNILLLKNKSKLNNDQKIKFENILNNSKLIGSNDTLVYAITNYLVDLNVEERKKVLDTITSTKDGMYSLLNSIHHNSSESKLDLLNVLSDKSDYSKRLMATQEILSDSYNKILNSPDFKDNPSYLTSFMFINDKYISESIKKLIDNGLIRAFNSNKKIDDFFNDIVTRNDMLSTYSKDTLSDYLIKNKINLQSSIWFLANNYKDLKNKSQTRELLERELEKTASFMIYNYTSFEESNKFFDLISSNEKFSFITNLILLNNYKSFDKDKINKILEKSINNKEIDIPVIYIMVFNYNNLLEKLKTKLLELSKNKKYSSYILNALAYNSDNISLKDKFELLNNLKPNIKDKENYVKFLVKEYENLDITRKNDFLEYTKDEKLRKIILEEVFVDNPKISQEQIILDVLKNKDSTWDFLLTSLRKDRFNKEFFKQKYPKQYQEIIKRLTEIYSEKIKKEKFDVESVFDQRHLDKKAIIYKNWYKLDDNLKEKFRNILYSETINDSVGIIMASIDFNDETEDTIEEFKFIKEMYKIIKAEIINNNKKLDPVLLDDLLSEPMLEKEFIELIISEINKGKINVYYLDNNLGKVLNVYSDKENIIHNTTELNNKVLLKNYLNEKLNLEAKKEFISDLFMSKNSNNEYIQYQNYLFTLDFLEKQKI